MLFLLSSIMIQINNHSHFISSLLVHNISNISFETSFHVVSLKFDNYVDNKLFTFHVFITHSDIHVLILLSNKSLIYTTPGGGVIVKEKNINRKETSPQVPHCLPTSLKHCSSDINQMKAVLHLGLQLYSFQVHTYYTYIQA